MSNFKYEIAFSFLKEDEGLAVKINDLLQDRLSTFIYSKKQEEVAGTDGEETFNRVFGEEARIVAILYRNSWGSTPWTRIEETAIRNRGYEEGYDFVVIIPLEKPPQVPKWLPKTHIWANIERYGVEGAANIIETKVQQTGGSTHEESLEERALRLKRQIDFEKEKRSFLDSKLGVRAAHEEFEWIAAAIRARIAKVSAETGIEFRIEEGADSDSWIEVYSDFHCVSLDWHRFYSNTLKDSQLRVELWEGGRPRSDRYFSRHRPPSQILKRSFDFDRDVFDAYCWSNEAESLSSPKLVEYCIQLLIDHLHKEELSRTRRK